jgi:hypothetical protein
MHITFVGMQSTIHGQYRGTNCHERGPDEPGNHPNDAAQRLVPRFIHASNDEVERRAVALPTNEASLSRSSIPSLAKQRLYTRDRSNRLLDACVKIAKYLHRYMGTHTYPTTQTAQNNTRSPNKAQPSCDSFPKSRTNTIPLGR